MFSDEDRRPDLDADVIKFVEKENAMFDKIQDIALKHGGETFFI